MAYIIGIDIGGTKIAVVMARTSGKIVEKCVLHTQVNRAAYESVEEILIVIKHMLKSRKAQKQLKAIGVGVPGAISPRDGIITESPNLPGWAGIPIRGILRKACRAPVYVDNDANVACLGEKHFGAGKKVDHFIYITVSTGVGGGIVSNGQLVRGVGGYGGEIGHLVVHPGGRKCNCGKKGCLEAYASGTAIKKIAKESVKKLSAVQSKRSKLSRMLAETGRSFNAVYVEKAAIAGDKHARKVYEDMGTDLGLGVSSLMQIFNPELIILGGSVSKAYSLFNRSFKKALKDNVWSVPHRECKIVRSKLGNSVADLGTIALIKDNMRL